MYRVLIVDDEKAIREQLPLTFEWVQYGFRVVGTAANGQLACNLLPSLQPDLILLDIRMPVMDGLQFLQWLHSSVYKHISVLLLTGYSEFDYAVTAMRYGARGYLTKPLDEEEIADYLLDIASDLDMKSSEASELSENIGIAEEAAAYIDEHFAEPLTVSSVAASLYVSPSHLGQTFRKAKGITFRQYLRNARLRRAQTLLECTNLHIYDIAHRVGFSESKYFVVCFEEQIGLSPVCYRREKSGKEIEE